MTIQDMPRPWLLAALADFPIAELARQDVRESHEDEHGRALPRADQRRVRLAAWRRDRYGHAPYGPPLQVL